MDNLSKALYCSTGECEGDQDCETCRYNQNEYNIGVELIYQAIDKIEALQKSNRNWRRKTQRLRKEIKELKEKENV